MYQLKVNGVITKTFIIFFEFNWDWRSFYSSEWMCKRVWKRYKIGDRNWPIRTLLKWTLPEMKLKKNAQCPLIFVDQHYLNGAWLKFDNVKWDACSRWLSSLYLFGRNDYLGDAPLFSIDKSRLKPYLVNYYWVYKNYSFENIDWEVFELARNETEYTFVFRNK